MPPAKTLNLLHEGCNHSLGLLTQEMRDGTEDLSEILFSEFVNFTYLLTVVRQSVSNKKFYLSLTMGLQISLGKLYDIKKGQRVAIQLLTSITILASRTLPKPTAAPKLGNMAELILMYLL